MTLPFENRSLIIPALNEEAAIAKVLSEVPKDLFTEIIVVDNGSDDRTDQVAECLGATVLYEAQKGYGNACLKALAYIKTQSQLPEVVAFIDADYSDYPSDLTQIITPISQQGYDFVLGARAAHLQENGAMTLPQRFGNWLATNLMRYFYKANFTDLGPLRAIKYDCLERLAMQDTTYGWTIEMQLKVVRQNMRYLEVPVRYKRRIGVSKISGTVKGVVLAGYKILSWIFKYRKG